MVLGPPSKTGAGRWRLPASPKTAKSIEARRDFQPRQAFMPEELTLPSVTTLPISVQTPTVVAGVPAQ